MNRYLITFRKNGGFSNSMIEFIVAENENQAINKLKEYYHKPKIIEIKNLGKGY